VVQESGSEGVRGMNGSRASGSVRVRHPANHPETGDGGRLAPRTVNYG